MTAERRRKSISGSVDPKLLVSNNNHTLVCVRACRVEPRLLWILASQSAAFLRALNSSLTGSLCLLYASSRPRAPFATPGTFTCEKLLAATKATTVDYLQLRVRCVRSIMRDLSRKIVSVQYYGPRAPCGYTWPAPIYDVFPPFLSYLDTTMTPISTRYTIWLLCTSSLAINIRLTATSLTPSSSVQFYQPCLAASAYLCCVIFCLILISCQPAPCPIVAPLRVNPVPIIIYAPTPTSR